jgi:MarR family transcriptional regulator, organic hydroperoxide resistance regulator
MVQTLGVTGPQRFVLRLVTRSPGISAGEVARQLHLDPSTLTGVLRRLESRGLIERKRDAADGRRQMLTATAQGARLAAPSAHSVEATVRKVLARTPPAHVERARSVVEALATALLAA